MLILKLEDKHMDKDYIKQELKIDISCDAKYKELNINKELLDLYYIESITDSVLIENIIRSLHKNDLNDIESALEFHKYNILNNDDEFVYHVLCGFLGVIYKDKYITIGVQKFNTRTPSEPNSEKVIRGPRDGFTESVETNVSLIRNRIRSSRVIYKEIIVGKYTKSKVILVYITDLVNKKALKLIEDKINDISVKDLSMTDSKLEELISGQKFNPFPLVKFTERPDVVSAHLMKGQIAVITEMSPSVMLAPITYFDQIHHAEEYLQTPAVGTFIRLIRFASIIMAFYILPAWILLVNNPQYIPSWLSFVELKEQSQMPIIAQVLIAEFTVEFIRLAAIHTPTPITTAMGVIAGLLIGEVAIQIGLFIPEVVLYTVLAQIGCYTNPSYELGYANKLCRIIFIIVTAIFGVWGFFGFIILIHIFLGFTKSFGKSYFYPLIPFNPKKFLKTMVRYPWTSDKH